MDTGHTLYGRPAEPHTLTGTAISAIADDVEALQFRVHRQAKYQVNECELWYHRDSAWHMFPSQPVKEKDEHPLIDRRYRQPSTLACVIPDNGGLLTPQSRDSAYNKNGSGDYDPLIRSTRKVLLRAGTRCRPNLCIGTQLVSTDGLMGYWRMEESTGNRLDSSGRGNDLGSAPTSGSVTQVAGKIDNAAHVTGGSYLFHTSAPDFLTGDQGWCVNGWFKLDNLTHDQVFGSKYGGDVSGSEFTIYFDSASGRMRLKYRTVNVITPEADFYFGPSLSAGVWYMITVRYRSTVDTTDLSGASTSAGGWQIEGRVNGAPGTGSNSSNGVNRMSAAGGYGFLIGGNASGTANYADAAVDEVSFWHRVVTDADVANLYNSSAGLAYPFRSGAILPTSTLAPSSGDISYLTDGVLSQHPTSAANWVVFGPASAAAFDIIVDLGASRRIKHAVIRFGTMVNTCSLPRSVEFGWSTDGSTYSTFAARPVGGTDGDWDDDYDGRAIEVIQTDFDRDARFIRFRIMPTGAQTLYIDELAVYGEHPSRAGALLGYNVFTGYLGASGEIPNTGLIRLFATDILKKLIDNNSNRLTTQFGANTGPVETADILYTLLTSAAYWHGVSGAYDAPFDTSDVGWSYGVGTTAFKWPIWQGKYNNIYGYVAELLGAIGMEIYGDGSGVAQIRDRPYRQLTPDRVMISDIDGNGDAWDFVRGQDDVSLRNKVRVYSASPDTAGSMSTLVEHPTSIADNGERDMDITDPIAADQTTREKIGSYIIRDFAYRDKTLKANCRIDWDFGIGRIYGFRASARPYLFAKTGTDRAQELWTVETYREAIHAGEWWADCNLIPFFGVAPEPPTALTATPVGGDDTKIDVGWTNSTESDVTTYRIYESASVNGPFTLAGSSATSPFRVGSLTPGLRYFFYVTAVGFNSIESIPSEIVSAVAGGAAGDTNGWTVTDLVGAFNSGGVAPAGANGYYSYVIDLIWTAPPVGFVGLDYGFFGFKQAEFRFAIDAIPANPSNINSWIRQDEWHGDRVGPGKEWDRVTDGFLTWPLAFRSVTNLSGHTIYVRMWTWEATNGRNTPSHASNVPAGILIP